MPLEEKPLVAENSVTLFSDRRDLFVLNNRYEDVLGNSTERWSPGRPRKYYENGESVDGSNQHGDESEVEVDGINQQKTLVPELGIMEMINKKVGMQKALKRIIKWIKNAGRQVGQ